VVLGGAEAVIAATDGAQSGADTAPVLQGRHFPTGQSVTTFAVCRPRRTPLPTPYTRRWRLWTRAWIRMETPLRTTSEGDRA